MAVADGCGECSSARLLTFDLEWWAVVAGFQETAEVDGNVGDFAGLEDGGMLGKVIGLLR